MDLNRSTHVRILEELAQTDVSSPHIISYKLDLSNGHVRNEMVHLNKHGLVERVEDGIYQITPHGQKALNHKELIGSDAFDRVMASAPAP